MSYTKRLLLIEDDETEALAFQLHAEAAGYRGYIAHDGALGFKMAEREKPDLILIDITLPTLHGLDLCKKIRNTASLRAIPLVLLGCPTDEIDQILGLEIGADDYLIKPLSLPLLFAKINALLRRFGRQERPSHILSFGPFTLQVDRHLLLKDKEMIPLTLSEFGILRRLLIHKGKSLSRIDLLSDFHDEAPFVVDRNIDVHVASLRKKLGKEHSYIKTIRGIGYQLCDGSFSSRKRRLTPLMP
jgi:two-component system alkaline phosphatase synthesis response regulator PhoP